MTMRRTEGPAAYLEALRHAADMLERGAVLAMSAVYDPTGVGRVSVTTSDGHDPGLPAFDNSDLETESTKAPTQPGKGQRVLKLPPSTR